jgi:hypothetical protein
VNNQAEEWAALRREGAFGVDDPFGRPQRRETSHERIARREIGECAEKL